jgi:hypothetical protein
MPAKETTLNEARALDGRAYRTLDDNELQLVNLYVARGKKSGVMVQIRTDADPTVLAECHSVAAAHSILARANSFVVVS